MNLSLRSVRRAITIAAATIGALALVPQSASAAVSCVANSYHEMMIDLHAAGDSVVIAAKPDRTITVNGLPCQGPNSPLDWTPTVDNTDWIDVDDLSSGGTRVDIDGAKQSFAPGFYKEAAGSEIEIVVELGGGTGTDTLAVRGRESGSTIFAGADGINLNYSDELFQLDSDIVSTGVDSLIVGGSSAADRISGQGGAGTGQPYAGWLSLHGFGGGDVLEGGEDPNARGWMTGGDGDDLLVAGAHGDRMQGGAGANTITGGPGQDVVGYTDATAGVRVDLAIAGSQDTGGAGVDTIAGVEGLVGSEHDDVLKGTGGDDWISGYGGADVLGGRGGTDYLDGGDGADTLGGTGDSYLVGGDGEDTADFGDSLGAVSVDLRLDGVEQPLNGYVAQTLLGIEDVLGSPFGDRLTGTDGANAIHGGPGADTIEGGEGADRLGGGPGIDAIDSRDTSPDSVSCGEGPDSLAVDALDAVAPDCAPAAPGGGDQAAPVLSVRVPRQSLRSVLARGLRVELTCSAACRAGGRLGLPRAAAGRLGIRRRIGRLTSLDLAAGEPVQRRVRLSRAARRALRDAGRVRLSLRAHAVDGAGRAAAPVRKAIRLRAR